MEQTDGQWWDSRTRALGRCLILALRVLGVCWGGGQLGAVADHLYAAVRWMEAEANHRSGDNGDAANDDVSRVCDGPNSGAGDERTPLVVTR